MYYSTLTIGWLAMALSASSAMAQDVSARTVQYHSQDVISIRAKLKYTTLIQVPPTEKIMEAATGDKDFWVVDVVGNFCFVHPAKAGQLDYGQRKHLQLYAAGCIRYSDFSRP